MAASATNLHQRVSGRDDGLWQRGSSLVDWINPMVPSRFRISAAGHHSARGSPARSLRPEMFVVYAPSVAISVRLAKRGDRETCVRLLTALLVEHSLPVDPAGIRNGVELFTPHSPAWLLLAGLDAP